MSRADADESLALNSRARDPHYNNNSEIGLAILGNPDRMKQIVEPFTETESHESQHPAPIGAAIAAAADPFALFTKQRSETTQNEQNDFFGSIQTQQNDEKTDGQDAFFFSARPQPMQALAPHQQQPREQKQWQGEDKNGGQEEEQEQQQEGEQQTRLPTLPVANAFFTQFPSQQPAVQDDAVSGSADAFFFPAGGLLAEKSGKTGVSPKPGLKTPMLIDNRITEGHDNSHRADTGLGGCTVSGSDDGGTGDRDHHHHHYQERPSSRFEETRRSERNAPNDADERQEADQQEAVEQTGAEAGSLSSDYYYSYDEDEDGESGSQASVSHEGDSVRPPNYHRSRRSKHRRGGRRRHRRHRGDDEQDEEQTMFDFQENLQRQVKERVETEKREMLMLFYEKETYEGVKMARKFTMQSDLNEMRWWYYKLIRDSRINDEVENMKNNIVQGARFLLFFNKTILKNPLNLRMKDFPKELSKQLNTDWDRHLRDFVKSKCGISGPKPNPVRNLAWNVVNSAINYHRNQMALEDQEEQQRKKDEEREKEKQRQQFQQRAFNPYQSFTAPQPAGFAPPPPIDTNASVEEQYRQLLQVQAWQRQNIERQLREKQSYQDTMQQHRSNDLAQQHRSNDLAQQHRSMANRFERPAAGRTGAVRDAAASQKTSPMYSPQVSGPLAAPLPSTTRSMSPTRPSAPITPIAAPRPRTQNAAAPAATIQSTVDAFRTDITPSVRPRSPPPPTFSTHRNALRQVLGSQNAANGASAVPSFMRPPATTVAAPAPAPQDFRSPTFGHNSAWSGSRSSPMIAPFVGRNVANASVREVPPATMHSPAINHQQQQPQQPPVPRERSPFAPRIGPHSINVGSTPPARLQQISARQTQIPDSSLRTSSSATEKNLATTAPPLPSAPSRRTVPSTLTRTDETTSPIPLPQAPSQRPLPIGYNADDDNDVAAERTSTGNDEGSAQQQQQQQQSPDQQPHLFLQPKRVKPLPPPQPRQKPPSPVGSATQRKPNSPLRSIRPPLASPMRQTDARLTTMTEAKPDGPAATMPLRSPASMSSSNNSTQSPSFVDKPSAPLTLDNVPIVPSPIVSIDTSSQNMRRPRGRDAKNSIELTLDESLDDERQQATAAGADRLQPQPQQQQRQRPPPLIPSNAVVVAKPDSEKTYDELMADLQRMHDEDSSEEDYDDLVAGQNGAPKMLELQADDKVSEVMELMTGFAGGSSDGAGKVPERQSNMYEDLDALLQGSEADTSLSEVGSRSSMHRKRGASSSESLASSASSSRRRRTTAATTSGKTKPARGKGPAVRRRRAPPSTSSPDSAKKSSVTIGDDGMFVRKDTLVFKRSSPPPNKSKSKT